MAAPRVAIGCFKYSGNAFSPLRLGRADFTIEPGEAMLGARGQPTTLGGFIAELDAAGCAVLPAAHLRAQTGGRLAADFFDPAAADLLQRFADFRPDGLLLELHGSGLVDGLDDPEGWLVGQLRAALPDAPIVVVLDQHANPSAELVEAASAVIGAATTPHVDFYDRGREAARLLLRLLRRETTAHGALARPPLVPAMQSLHTLGPGPLARLTALAAAREREPGLHDVSLFAGFAYADVARAGFGVVATAERPELAQQVADELAAAAWAERQAMLVRTVPLAEAVERARRAEQGPVVLADVADSPPGGGSSDTTALLAELLRQRADGAVVAAIWDPAAVQACVAAGLHGRLALELGGKVDRSTPPLAVEGEVVALAEGTYQPRSQLSDALIARRGPTAVLRVDGVEVILTSRRSHCFELEFLRSLGLEPTARRILAVKSELHYALAYGPIAAEMIVVDAPGPVTPILERLPFRGLRRPAYPLDPL